MSAARFSLSLVSTLGPVRILATDRGVGDIRFTRTPSSDSDDMPQFLRDCAMQVTEYLEGRRRTFTDLPLCIRGTGFQQDVWSLAAEIPFGQTETYGVLASKLGMRGAQAVGQALTKNPLALIIPCHRIVPSSDRTPGGYAWGTWRKKWLLRMEGKN